MVEDWEVDFWIARYPLASEFTSFELRHFACQFDQSQIARLRFRSVVGLVMGLAIQAGRLTIFAIFGQRWLARNPLQITKPR